MKKWMKAAGVGAIGLATWAGFSGATTRETAAEIVLPARDDDAGRVESPYGMACAPVPRELAAQLALEEGDGLLVVDVEAESAAAESGLERFDVIVAVDADPAGSSAARVALSTPTVRGRVLRVVRAGVARRVALAAPPEVKPPSGLLSTDALGPDHPFRRLAELEALRAGYAEQAEGYAERVRDLDASARAARAEAQQAAVELAAACKQDVAELLAAREVELLRVVDEAFAEDRPSTLARFRVELLEVVPQERRTALTDGLQALASGMRDRVGAQARLDGEEGEAKKRAHARFLRVGETAGRLVSERVARAWKDGRQELDEHAQRLGARHDERVAWSVTTLAKTREQLHERITCAIDRIEADFGKRLDQRLKKNDVPAPGEIDAALEDVMQQLDAWTRRFVERTDAAQMRYERALARRPERLVPSLAKHVAQSDAAFAALEGAVAVALERVLAEPLAFDASWRATARVNAAVDGLELALQDAVDAGRDALRAQTVALEVELDEERVVTEHAWEDWKRALGAIHGEAANDCWKIDGPHLDGRFPVEPKDAAPQPRGEVALLDVGR